MKYTICQLVLYWWRNSVNGSPDRDREIYHWDRPAVKDMEDAQSNAAIRYMRVSASGHTPQIDI